MKQKILVGLLALVVIGLRLINLGYSDYQGDEIKALYIPENGTDFSSYLLDQRKGPTQFFVTAAVKLLTPDYTDRFIARLPFALAGVFSVFFFYKFVEIYFGKRVALFAGLFFATNGFIVAFSRIVQYQSFVILFMTMALYYFSLALYREKWSTWGLYSGAAAWALSLLSHYDGIFIFPVVFYIIARKFLETKRYKHILGAGILFTVLTGIFYIPFIFNLSQATLNYWQGRIEGNVSGKISSSKYLFTVYQPIYVIHIYTSLLILGLISLIPTSKEKLRHFIRDNQYILTILLWALIPFIFMEGIVYIPGTHIYTYLIPLFILMAVGIDWLLNKNFLVKPMYAGLAVLFLFLSLQSYAIFVDHKAEYPWQEEKFLIWTFPKPTPHYHLSMFGFPYYRFWDEVGKIIALDTSQAGYTTNERTSISRYHVKLPKDSAKAGYYVHIPHPQSYEIEISEKVTYWTSKYQPIMNFDVDGNTVTQIYLMPQGDLETIKALGY